MDRALSAFLSGEQMVFGGVGVVVATLLLLVLRLVLPKAERPRLRAPFVLLLLHLATVFARGFVSGSAPTDRALMILAVFFLALSVARTSFLLLVDYVLGRRSEHALPRIIRDILQGLIYLAAGFVTLRAAGVELGGLLATSALLTAVIGLSLQETLGNMFAGLAIQMQRPFEVGDWIQFDADPENVGRVIEINWRATKVYTLEQVEVIVPNGTLAKVPIRNYTKPSPVMRRSVYVQAGYDTPPARVHQVIRDAIVGVPGVLTSPPTTIVTRAFMDSGVEYWVRFFTDRFAERDVISGAVQDRIWYAFNREGIEIPFPIRMVHMHDAAAQKHQQREERHARRDKILRCVDFLAALPKEAFELLASKSRVRRYAEGEVIIRQGDPGDELFIIDHGEVSIHHTTNETEVELARLHPHEFFGEMSLTTGEVRTATARASTAAELLVVDQSALRAVLQQSPELASTISEVVASRQSELAKSAREAQAADQTATDDKKSELLGRIRSFFKLG
jgi:small-conductance mechanosensitive channel/CRP-like cAMP-binding protein